MIMKHTVNNTLLPYYPSYTEIHIVTLKPAEGKLRSLTQNLSSHKFLFWSYLKIFQIKWKQLWLISSSWQSSQVSSYHLIQNILNVFHQFLKTLFNQRHFYTYCLNFLLLLLFKLFMIKCSQCWCYYYYYCY